MRRTGPLIPFCGMIEDDIEDHPDTVIMQAADEPFQLRSLPVIFDLRAVARVGRKKLTGL